MADIDRVEVLLRMAENLRQDNNVWRNEVWKEGRQRAIKLNEMIALFEKEYGLLAQERELLKQYLPMEEPMPRAVTQGPRPNEPVQRKANP